MWYDWIFISKFAELEGHQYKIYYKEESFVQKMILPVAILSFLCLLPARSLLMSLADDHSFLGSGVAGFTGILGTSTGVILGSSTCQQGDPEVKMCGDIGWP